MNDLITLTGVRAFGYHGVLEQEKRDGQEFVVDIVIGTNFDVAAQTDELNATVDYGAVALLVAHIVSTTRFDLIESLSREICRQIRSLAHVEWVRCTIHKPAAPIEVPFADVSVTTELR